MREPFVRAGIAFALIACSRSDAPPPAPAASATAAPAASVVDVGAVMAQAPDAASPPVAFDDAAWQTAKPTSGHSVGHTSIVYKLRLNGGLTAAYKPRSKVGDHRYRGEVAAYRLAKSLGLDNVPPCTIRAFKATELKAAVGVDVSFADVVPEADGRVMGALIPWIQDLRFLKLESDPWLSRWKGWLTNGADVPKESAALASQISTMVVFDYVTGNWDRWSGGNVGTDDTQTKVLFIDNDGAFFDPPPAPATAKQLGTLEHVDKFSRAFVTALRAADVAGAVGEESKGVPLLSPRVVAGVNDRRTKALAIVDGKIAKLGEAAVLAFP